jgi:hypothetical protein
MGYRRLEWMSIKKENEAWTSAIISKSKKLTGGDKPHPYLLGKGSSVGAGFIPARKG